MGDASVLAPQVQPQTQTGPMIGGGSSSLPTFSAGMTSQQAQDLANQYLQAAGLPPDSGGTWANYWTQFGQNDPNYFMTRLLNGAAQQGGNMTQFQSLQSPTAPGGWGPGTSGFGPATGGASGGGSTVAGQSGFNFDPNSLADNPTLKFITQQGINAIGANKAAQGTVLGTGTGKDYIDYAQQAASQFEPIAYNQAQNTFQTNFQNLGSLAQTGYSASTSIGNAQAAGAVNNGNAASTAVGTIGSNVGQAVDNYNAYKQFMTLNGKTAGS